jgi:uncharacterized tellurite resistance protein B-like protein
MPYGNQFTSNRNKRRYLYHLIAVAYADNDINGKEMSLLRERASELGFTREVLESLIKESKNISLPIAEGIHERMAYLEDIVKMATVDGVVVEAEEKYCIRICELLKLDEGYLQELFDANLNGNK